jgi:hypothetical protein
MNDFLSSVKADLLDRRMLPILALVGAALLAALAYALLGGGGSTASPSGSTASSAPAVTTPSGIAISQAQSNTGEPVAETTSGSTHRAGATRNPFAPLPGTKAAGAASTASSPKSSSGSSPSTPGAPATTSTESGGGSSSGGSSSGGATPTPEAKKPATKEKSQTVYHVAVRFGTAPAGTPPLTAQLTPYDDLKRQQPLPDAKQPLIVFRGVIAGGKRATFTLVGEAILRGSAVCLPSASQCQAINLRPGQTEELEYIPLGGAAITYQLQIVSITSSKASASAASRSFKRQSKSGLQLLRHAGLTALPGLRYSRDKGVLVFKSRHASAARAHVAARAWGARL